MAKREIKPTKAADAHEKSRNILLVDDDPGIREALGRALGCRNYHVIAAATGRDALREFASTPIDIVLLDLNLGAENGWDTFQDLISLQPLLPIIIVTGQPDLYHGRQLSGARAFLEKPLNLPLLFEILENLAGGP